LVQPTKKQRNNKIEIDFKRYAITYNLFY